MSKSIDKDIRAKLDYSNIQLYEVSDTDCENLALKAKEAGIQTIVVSPSSLPTVERLIGETNINIAVGISYPSGAYLIESKVEEIKGLFEVSSRFNELYVVMAVGRFLSGYEDETRAEIEAIVKAASGKTVKLVIEAAMMNQPQKKKICDISAQYGVEYIVASTGFTPYDVPLPTVKDIKELKDAAGEVLKIIACGDIKTKEQAMRMIDAGADRVCTFQAFDMVMYS